MPVGHPYKARYRTDDRIAVAVDRIYRSINRPVLQRPYFKVRHRIPFLAIRRYALLALLLTLAFRSNGRCVPDRQPAPSPVTVDICNQARLMFEAMVIEAALRVHQ